MRLVLTAWLLTSLFFTEARAQEKAELVEARIIWDRAEAGPTDLVRLKGRWAAVCAENADTNGAALRILTSADGVAWEATARIASPTPARGLFGPKLVVTPDGQLTLTALGPALPAPKFGGAAWTMAWHSRDGRTWSGHEPLGPENYPLGRAVWHKGVRYVYGRGVICGIAQTVKVFGGPAGKPLEDILKQTFSGFFPGDASLLFAGDTAHCLMTRYSAELGNPLIPGFLGTSRPPYKTWEWKELDTRFTSPNLLRLADGRAVAAVGLFDGKARTSLCHLDPAAGKLTELVALPAGGAIDVGLAEYDGHVWASYHAGGKVHLAKVKLGAGS